MIYQNNTILNNDREYLIEVSVTKLKLFIMAIRKDRPLKIVFPKKQGMKLLEELNMDFEKLLEFL